MKNYITSTDTARFRSFKTTNKCNRDDFCQMATNGIMTVVNQTLKYLNNYY